MSSEDTKKFLEEIIFERCCALSDFTDKAYSFQELGKLKGRDLIGILIKMAGLLDFINIYHGLDFKDPGIQEMQARLNITSRNIEDLIVSKYEGVPSNN